MTTDMPTRTATARNASDTRGRILDAARSCFSRKSYENVGVREIAGEAGIDAALVNRYFGGKEGLFAEAIQGAFHVEEHLPESLETLGEFLVAQVLGDPEPDEGFNALRLLLLASTSPLTASAVSERFRAEFVEPLARKLRGKDSLLRAELIGAYVIGLATMRHLLASPALASTSQNKTAAFIGTAIQACVTPSA